MKFTEQLIGRIERNADNKKKKSRYRVGLGLNVQNSIGGATIFANNWGICEIEELQQMIDELTIMKQAIEEETGIEF